MTGLQNMAGRTPLHLVVAKNDQQTFSKILELTVEVSVSPSNADAM